MILSRISDTYGIRKCIEEVQIRTGFIMPESRMQLAGEVIDRRMMEMGLSDAEPYEKYKNYFNIIQRDEREFSYFAGALTIKESYLFREDAHFELLTDHILPGLRKHRSQIDPVRILVAGCANGEEAVSIAIAIKEKFINAFPYQFVIEGIDIDRKTIESAGTGVYTGLAFRSIRDDIRKKYFRQIAGETWEVDKNILKNIRYHHANLKTFGRDENLNHYDIIFYRNVSIYFNPEDQRTILETLSKKLNDGGYLITSSSETNVHDVGILELIGLGNIFFFRKTPDYFSRGIETGSDAGFSRKKNSAATPSADIREIKKNESPAVIPSPEKKPESVNKNSGSKGRNVAYLLNQCLDLLMKKQYDDSIIFADKVIELDPAICEPILFKASARIHQRRFEDAANLCSRILEMDPWNIESRMLLAFTCQYLDDPEGMENCLKQVVYLRQDLWIAHFLLARLFMQKADMERSRTEYMITQKLLHKVSDDSRFSLIFPLVCSRKDVEFLCRSELEKISRMVNANGN